MSESKNYTIAEIKALPVETEWLNGIISCIITERDGKPFKFGDAMAYKFKLLDSTGEIAGTFANRDQEGHIGQAITLSGKGLKIYRSEYKGVKSMSLTISDKAEIVYGKAAETAPPATQKAPETSSHQAGVSELDKRICRQNALTNATVYCGYAAPNSTPENVLEIAKTFSEWTINGKGKFDNIKDGPF